MERLLGAGQDLTAMRTRRRQAAFACIAAACWAVTADACINTYHSDVWEQQRAGHTQRVQEIAVELNQKFAAEPTVENGNDLAVAQLLTGKRDAAITLLRDLEQKHPGNAFVAANLGTALELAGQDEEAHRWIREGVLRDVNLHQGSEFLHARILEVKLALARNPRWFDRNNIVQLDFGSGDFPEAPGFLPVEEGRLKGAAELIRHIEIQLEERTFFVKPPDAIVGDLYASAADLAVAGAVTYLDGAQFTADPVKLYEAALKYGAPHEKRIRARLERFRKSSAGRPIPQPAPKIEAVAEVEDYPVVEAPPSPPPRLGRVAIIVVGGAAVLAVGALVVARIRKRREAGRPDATKP